MEELDKITIFLKHQIIIHPEQFIAKRQLYRAYVKYCFAENLPTASNQKFKRKLLATFPYLRSVRRTINGKDIRCWLGIAMRE